MPIILGSLPRLVPHLDSAPVKHKLVRVDQEQVKAPSSPVFEPDQRVMKPFLPQVDPSMRYASVPQEPRTAIQSASGPSRIVRNAPANSRYIRASVGVNHSSMQAPRRKSPSACRFSSESESSDSDDGPVTKRAKTVMEETNRARTRPKETKTALKKQGIEHRKEIKELKKKLEEKEQELSKTKFQIVSQAGLAAQWESKYGGEVQETKTLQDEPRELRSLNSKLTIENNKLISTAGRNVPSILEEEVKGQLDGMRIQWAKLGTPPKTADHGVDAGMQTDDDGTSEKQAKLREKLNDVAAVARIRLRALEIANEQANLLQGNLKVEMLKAFKLMEELNGEE